MSNRIKFPVSRYVPQIRNVITDFSEVGLELGLLFSVKSLMSYRYSASSIYIVLSSSGITDYMPLLLFSKCDKFVRQKR